MISKIIRNALKTQIADAAAGVNARLAALAGSYPDAVPYVIDWSSTSLNFIWGTLDPDKFEETSVFTYPLVTIDTLTAQDQGLIFSATFAGKVVGVIDIHHSWPNESVVADFSDQLDMSEDAFLSCIKDTSRQQWGGGVNNLLLMKSGVNSGRTKVTFGGQNWRQSLRIVCPFELAV
jgi:hypothetical protein